MMWWKDTGKNTVNILLTNLSNFTEAHVLDREMMGSQQAWEDTALQYFEKIMKILNIFWK